MKSLVRKKLISKKSGGSQGDTGPTGPSGGPTGPTGPIGYTGYTGYTGPAGSGGGASIISHTVSEMQALVGSFVPGQMYLITDCAGSQVQLLVKAYNASSLENQGSGLYQNVNMSTSMQCDIWYNLDDDYIYRVYEPVNSNDSNSLPESFPFDDTLFYNNSFDNVSFVNYIKGTNNTSFERNYIVNTTIDFNSIHTVVIDDCFIIGTNSSPDITVAGGNVHINECYINNSQLLNLGVNTLIEKSEIVQSIINVNSHTDFTYRNNAQRGLAGENCPNNAEIYLSGDDVFIEGNIIGTGSSNDGDTPAYIDSPGNGTEIYISVLQPSSNLEFNGFSAYLASNILAPYSYIHIYIDTNYITNTNLDSSAHITVQDATSNIDVNTFASNGSLSITGGEFIGNILGTGASVTCNTTFDSNTIGSSSTITALSGQVVNCYIGSHSNLTIVQEVDDSSFGIKSTVNTTNGFLKNCTIGDNRTISTVTDHTNESWVGDNSTFSCTVDCDVSLSANVLTIPNYVGKILLVSSNSTETIKGFTGWSHTDVIVTFKNGGFLNNVVYNNSGTLIFPTPSSSTTIYGTLDFITFKKQDSGSYTQIASEQY